MSLPELTERQQDVVALLMRGFSTERIARELFISVATVRNHLGSAMTKTGAHSRVELVALASGGLVRVRQPSERILEFLDAAGVPVTDEQRRVLMDQFTCRHVCAVHPAVDRGGATIPG